MLPRRVRARANIVTAECVVYGKPLTVETNSNTNGVEEDGCDADGRRRSSRARVETQAPSTIQLVEGEKAKQRAALEAERRAEKERQRAIAEEWAKATFDPTDLSIVRSSADAVGACHFLSAFSEFIGAGPFSLPEIEMALVAGSRSSGTLRRALAALIRASRLPLAKGPDGERAPSIEAGLAFALYTWDGFIARVRELDENDQDVPEVLMPFMDGEELHGIIEGLGDLRELAKLLRTGGEKVRVSQHRSPHSQKDPLAACSVGLCNVGPVVAPRGDHLRPRGDLHWTPSGSQLNRTPRVLHHCAGTSCMQALLL